MQKMTVSGKVVGDLDGSTLIKRGKQVVKMYEMDGYGIPQHLALNPRIKKIELHTDDKILTARVGAFIENGIPYHRPPYEPQFILPVNYFAVRDKHQAELI